MVSSIRRLVFLPTALFSSSLLFAERAFAGIGNPQAVPLGQPDLRTAIVTIINVTLTLLGLIAAAVIIIAGIRLIFSQGDETAKDEAKKTVLYAVAGLIIILFAKAIVVFVISLG